MRRARIALITCLVLLSGALASTPATASSRALPDWASHIVRIIRDRPFSVVVGQDGEVWFRHLGWVRRPPASNEKLLLSMTLLARYDPARTIRTEARTDGELIDGVLNGNLWLVGHGDPETDAEALKTLAAAVEAAGVHRVTGRVIGGIGPFARDWFAPGWRDYFPEVYIPLPTALTFRTNTDHRGTHIADPERRAAIAFTQRLEGLGVQVRRNPEADPLPGSLTPLAQIRSQPLATMLRHMNLASRNFWAEVLGKGLAYDRTGTGTIAGAARAICAFVARRGLDFTCHDASGLSYDNRATADGIVRLLWFADGTAWGDTLRASLPMAGQGTLEDRLAGIRIRAKTGTLIDASALSGWIWTEQAGRVEFSILSSGYDDTAAKRVEDKIVGVISAEALDPTP